MPDFSHLANLATDATLTARLTIPEITVHGQELAPDGNPKPDGCTPVLFVVSTGEKNVEYSRKIAAVALQRAKQRAAMTTEEWLRANREARARFRKLAPALVVKGWANVYETTPNGPREVPFSISACEELFAPEDAKGPDGKPKPGLPDQIVDRVIAFCSDEANFTHANVEAVAKN
jgi:hypothetical protein